MNKREPSFETLAPHDEDSAYFVHPEEGQRPVSKDWWSQEFFQQLAT